MTRPPFFVAGNQKGDFGGYRSRPFAEQTQRREHGHNAAFHVIDTGTAEPALYNLQGQPFQGAHGVHRVHVTNREQGSSAIVAALSEAADQMSAQARGRDAIHSASGGNHRFFDQGGHGQIRFGVAGGGFDSHQRTQEVKPLVAAFACFLDRDRRAHRSSL